MRPASPFSPLRNLGFILLTVRLLLFPPLTHAQGVDQRRDVIAAVEKLAKKTSPEDVLEGLRSSFSNLHLISASQTLSDARSHIFSGTTNRMSVAFTANQQAGVFFIRPDAFVTTPRPHLRSVSPIIVIAYQRKLSVFDTTTIAEFTQNGMYSFHGFVSSRNGIPSVIASVGPVGSANAMWFYRFDFNPQDDDTVRTSCHLLLDEAHVVDFAIDLKHLSLSVNCYNDKWDPESRTNRAISLVSHEANR